MRKLWLLPVMGMILVLVMCGVSDDTGAIAVYSEPTGADVYLDDSLKEPGQTAYLKTSLQDIMPFL